LLSSEEVHVVSPEVENQVGRGSTGVDKPVRVVLCDDQPVFLLGLAQLLELEEPEITIAGMARTAEEADAVVAREKPDAVLIDVAMLGTRRANAFRRMLAASPRTKVIVLTGTDSSSDLYAALKSGAVGFLTKDRGMEDVIDALRVVLRGHLIVPARLTRRLLNNLGPHQLELTELEERLLGLIAAGATNADMAAELHLSVRTVRRRLEELYAKHGLADRVEAALYANERGLTPDDHP